MPSRERSNVYSGVGHEEGMELQATPIMTDTLIILDGGTGRELAWRGAPFRQPEWSAFAASW